MLLYTPILFCKLGFYNNIHLRLPCMPALAAPVYRFIASGKSPDKAVATGGGGDGGGATAGTFEGLVFCEQEC